MPAVPLLPPGALPHGTLSVLSLPAVSVPGAVCTPATGALGAACSTIGGVARAAGSAAGSVVGFGVGSVLDAVSNWVTSGAVWLLGRIGAVLASSTAIDLGAPWFRAHYATMAALAGVVIVPLLLLGVLQALYRQNASMLLRSVLVNVPLAVLLTAVAVTLVQLGLSVTDSMCAAVSGGSGSDAGRFMSTVATALLPAEATGQTGAPSFVLFLGGIAVVVGAVMVWLELLLRAAAVYVAVLFLPLALAGLAWPAISHWSRRLADTLAALVLGKLVIVAVLSLAAGALSGGTGSTPSGAASSGGGFASVLGGAALLLLAALAPWSLFRLLPFLEAGAVGHLEGVSQRARHLAAVPASGLANVALRAAAAGSLATGPIGAVGVAAASGGGPGAVGHRRGGGGDGGRGGVGRGIGHDGFADALPDGSANGVDGSGGDGGWGGGAGGSDADPLPWEPGGSIPRMAPHPHSAVNNRRVADLVAGRDPFAHGPPPLEPMSRHAVPALAPGVTYERPLPRQTGALRPDHLGRDHLGPVLIGGIQTPDDVGPVSDRPDGAASRVRYRLPPLERRGVIAGWRAGQVAAVAGGLVLAVLSVRSRPSLAGVALAVAWVGGAVALAFWPIAGRTGEQWLPVVVRWGWAGATGHRFAPASGPGTGTLVDVPTARDGGPPWRMASRRAPTSHSVFDGLRLVAGPADAHGPGMGVLVDEHARTVTAVLEVRGHSFALLAPPEQDARVAAWARVLASLAREGSAVYRLQWVETCLPDDGGAVRSHLDEHRVLDDDAPAVRSYRRLLGESSPVTRRHRVLVAVSVHRGRAARAIRASGGGLGGALVVLGREVGAVATALAGADIGIDGLLDRDGLADTLAGALRPAPPGGAAGGPAPATAGRSGDPWPMGTDAGWESVRTDGTWHATYWVAEWPRVDVHPDFLGPVLFAPLRRTLAVVMEPVDPTRAARQVAQARTAGLADGELRRRNGFLSSARHTRERQSVDDRDVELTDGHAQFRYSRLPGGDRRQRRGPRRGVRRPRAGRRAGPPRRAPPLRAAGRSAALPAAHRTGPVVSPVWSPRTGPGLPAHVATTRHLCAAYPLVAEAGLGHRGVLIGRDVLGGSFVYDPFALYRAGVVTNPNMVVIGQIGRGKSSFVKSYLWRQAVFGRSAWVIDPKGEYGPAVRGLGRSSPWPCGPVVLSASTRSTPVASVAPGDGDGGGPAARRAALTASLAVSCLGRDLRPRERAAIDAALRAAADARGAAVDGIAHPAPGGGGAARA